MCNQPRCRRVQGGGVRSGVCHDRREARGQLLAQFDAPLVERVDVPDSALCKHLVLIKRDEPPKHARIEVAVEKRARRPAARKALVRREARGVSLARALLAGQRVGFRRCAPAHQGLSLREAIGDQKIVMMRVGIRRRRRDEEV